jgi:preprotein translocase subunit SecB
MVAEHHKIEKGTSMTEEPKTPEKSEDQEPSGGGNGSEPPAESTEAGTDAEKPPIAINAQYVKDLSFEAPATPGVFRQMQSQSPNISVNVDVEAKTLDPSVYEVTLNITATCKFADTAAFLVELSYGGVFSLNVDDQYIRPVLLIECPRLLFPFARQIIANTTSNGGFLPLMLAPVDFAGLYQREVQQRSAQAAAESKESSAEPN